MRAVDKLDRLGDLRRAAVARRRAVRMKAAISPKAQVQRQIAIEISLVARCDRRCDAGSIRQSIARLRDSKIGQEGRAELEEISRLVTASGYGADRIRVSILQSCADLNITPDLFRN